MSEENRQGGLDRAWDRVRAHPAFRFSVLYAGASWTALQMAGLLGASPDRVREIAVGVVILYFGALVVMFGLAGRRGRSDETRTWLPQGRRLAAAGIGLLVLGTAGWYVARRVYAGSVTPGADTIAVLPFSSTGTGVAEYGVGMVDLLAPALDEVGGIRTINARTVLHRWNERAEGGTLDLPGSLALGREVGAGSVLLGTVARLGPSLTLQADLVGVETGETLARARVDGDPDSVLVLVDRLAVALLREVWRSRGPLPTVDVAGITTSSLPAMRAFLRGERAARASNWGEAIGAFEEAVARDSTFALAYQRLSQSYGWDEGLGSPKAVEYAERAWRWADRLPERERSLLAATRDFERFDFAALDTMTAFVQRHPDDPYGQYMLGDVRYHVMRQLALEPEAVYEPFERALALDPTMTFAHHHPMEVALGVGDSAVFARHLVAYERSVSDSLAAPWRTLFELRWGPPDSLLPRYVAAHASDPQGEHFGRVNRAAYVRVAQDPRIDPEILYPIDEANRRANEARWPGSTRDWDVRVNVGVKLGKVDEPLRRLEATADEDSDGAARSIVSLAIAGVFPDSVAEPWVPVLAGSDSASSRRMLHDWRLHTRDLEGARAIDLAVPADSGQASAEIRGRADQQTAWRLLVAGDTTGYVARMDSVVRAHGYRWNTLAMGGYLMFPYAVLLARDPDRRKEGIRRLRLYTEEWFPTMAVPAWYQIGRALEEEGDVAGAIVAYDHVVRLWRDADPWNRPTVEAASRAIERLAGEGR